jgi:hypothetical protein
MPSGALASIAVCKETTFKTDPAITYNGVFGHGTKITSLERSNGVQRIFGLGSRAQQVNLETIFSGSISVEYVLSNPYSFMAALGKTATTGPDVNSLYTHTFTEQDTLPTYAIKNNQELGTTDAQSVLLGAVMTNKTLTCSVGDPVVCSDDFVYATELFSTTAFVAQIQETLNIYSFAHGTFALPDGTTVANVQNCEIGISENADMIYGLGARTGATHVDKQREYTVRASVYMTDPAKFWRYVYAGGSGTPATGTAPTTMVEIPSLTLTLDNGGAAGAQRQIKLAFTNVMMDTHSMPQDIGAPIIEDATLFPRGLSVTAINPSATTEANYKGWVLGT